MRKLGLIVLLIFFLQFDLYTVPIARGVSVDSTPEKILKVFMVQSYEQNHFCGAPQLYGVKEAIAGLRSHGYKLVLREFYMNTKTRNTTQSTMKQVARLAYNAITSFNPDYIFVFDDNAFKYLAIQYLVNPDRPEKWKVIFSGINQKLSEYKEEFQIDEKRLAGVEEITQLQKLHKWLESVNFIASKYYLFTDSTFSSYLLTHNIKYELSKYGHKNVEVIQMDSMQDLRSHIRDLNRDDSRGVIFAMQTALFDKDSGKILTMYDILREIGDYNTKHLEVGVSSIATNPNVGMACAVGPDYYDMGMTAGNIMVDSVISNKFESRVSLAVNNLTVNTARMSELGLISLYKEALTHFDKIYTTIED